MFGNRKFWLFFFAAALLAIGGSLIGWQSTAQLFDRETLVQFFSRMGEHSAVEQNAGDVAIGVSLFLVAHVIANAIGMPGTVLVVVGGAAYVTLPSA